jgi:hypothetical protein
MLQAAMTSDATASTHPDAHCAPSHGACLRQGEDVQHATLRRVLRQVGHGGREAEGDRRVLVRLQPQRGRTRPAADASQDRHVLPPVGTEVRDGWPMIPDPVRNRHNSSPVRACTALNQRSIVP